jgi:hypothetical protein
MTRARLLIAGILVLICGASFPASSRASFGFLPGPEGFEIVPRAEGGALARIAGSHPYELAIHMAFNRTAAGGGGVALPDGDVRDLRLDLPPGLLFNPAAVARCTPFQFNQARTSPFEGSQSGEACPDASQIGTAEVDTAVDGDAARRFGIFSLDPPPGVPAQLGLAPYGRPIVLDVQIRTGADNRYTLAIEGTNLPQSLDLRGLDLTLWGIPWAASHNDERGDCLNETEPGFAWGKCSVGSPSERPPLAYLTMPTDCDQPLAFGATATAWQQAGPASTSFSPTEGGGPPVRLERCGDIRFAPEAFGQLINRRASSPTGFRLLLDNDQRGLVAPNGRIVSQPRRTVVTLPPGVTINPSLAAGLGFCTLARYAAETSTSFPGEGCPNDSKIGEFRLHSPLFEGTIEGSIYLAQPDDPDTPQPGAENPSDSLLGLYLVAKESNRGILVKVPGRLDPDPADGRLIATFDDLPQLPYTQLEVRFREGQRAPLVTPPQCGTASTAIELTPWLGGLGSVTARTDSPVDSGVEGSACPSGTAGFAPAATGGSVNSNVGSYTPFYLHLTRTDAEQEITSYSAILPKGITGRIAGVPFCPDAAIAAARGRSGVAETLAPSCPAASQIGRTISGYGVGQALAYSTGRIYMAGPYHGSPLSIVTINAATVGPFDLGTIVIRSAFEVDPLTAQLRIDATGSDPIPHILEGIPLHLRDIRIFIDRPQFTRNPSSCEPSELISSLTGSGALFGDSSDDSSAVVRNHFQLLNCRTLGFRPKLGLRLRGGTHRDDHPSLRAVFAARPGDANLKAIAVTTPHALFLAQNHIRGVCTRKEFAADACPADSVYGQAVAYTPLFDEPLRGPVYLRSSTHPLPDLVASLSSGAVRIVLEGRIGSAKGGIRTGFKDLPDAEINRFVLQMYGGKRGLLVNSTDICAFVPTATVKALGQNNLGRVFRSKLRGRCKNGDRRPHRRGGRR